MLDLSFLPLWLGALSRLAVCVALGFVVWRVAEWLLRRRRRPEPVAEPVPFRQAATRRVDPEVEQALRALRKPERAARRFDPPPLEPLESRPEPVTPAPAPAPPPSGPPPFTLLAERLARVDAERQAAGETPALAWARMMAEKARAASDLQAALVGLEQTRPVGADPHTRRHEPVEEQKPAEAA